MSASRSAASCSSSVLVRSSIERLPRSGEQRALALRLDQRGEVRRFRVVDLQVFRAHRRQLGERLLRLEQLLLARGEFFRRGDVDHVAFPGACRGPRAHDDVERLVPRHVLQAQRDVALDRVADDDVLAARLGEQLQHRAGLDVPKLSVSRSPRYSFLPRIGGRSGLGPLPQLEHVLAIALVAELLVVARRVDDDAAPFGVLVTSNELTGVAKSTTS